MTQQPKPSNDWKEDCMRWHGRLLDGERSRWCADWDFLPIDESCVEMQSCGCIIEGAPTDITADLGE